MCERTGIPPAFTCTVGDLKPGQWYHDPNGETWMVTNLKPADGTVVVVNTGNGPTNSFGNALKGDELKGTLTPVDASIKLGHDRDGRLYTSTYLNGWYCEPEPTEDETPTVVLPDDAIAAQDASLPNTTSMGDI